VDIAVLNNISPIRINRGKAVNDHESILFHTELAINPPIFVQIDKVGGRLILYRSIPLIPAMKSENPIQTPESKNKNIIANITTVRIKGSDIIV
jgi:hypothetical protein